MPPSLRTSGGVPTIRCRSEAPALAPSAGTGRQSGRSCFGRLPQFDDVVGVDDDRAARRLDVAERLRRARVVAEAIAAARTIDPDLALDRARRWTAGCGSRARWRRCSPVSSCASIGLLEQRHQQQLRPVVEHGVRRAAGVQLERERSRFRAFSRSATRSGPEWLALEPDRKKQPADGRSRSSASGRPRRGVSRCGIRTRQMEISVRHPRLDIYSRSVVCLRLRRPTADCTPGERYGLYAN